jgi:hypothetical protein
VNSTKIVETNSGRLTRVEPKVTACDPVCLFEDITNKWCFYTLDPTFRMGWEWNQIYGKTSTTTPVKYWQIKLAPFATAMGYIQMIMDISRLIYVDFIVDMASFKASTWINFIFTEAGYVCWGVGYDTQ